MGHPVTYRPDSTPPWVWIALALVLLAGLVTEVCLAWMEVTS